MEFNKLTKHLVKGLPNLEVDFSILAKLQLEIKDKEYFIFISEVVNGGFFFDKALHIYGSCKEPDYHNIIVVNNLIKLEYKELVKGLIFFGQDALGNQFGYDKNEIVFFNLESTEREVIAKSFKDWINVLLNDLDFFTGHSLVASWNGIIKLNERLCPKKPFIIGGKFEIENLYTDKYPSYISMYANIARQVHNLPEGTDIVIKPIE